MKTARENNPTESEIKIIQKIESLKDSHVYMGLYDTVKKIKSVGHKVDPVLSSWDEMQYRNFIEALNLKHGILSSGTIKYKHAYGTLSMIGLISSFRLKKIMESTLDEYKREFNVYERLIEFGWEFDTRKEDPPLAQTAFYQAMKNIKWDGEAAKIHKKFEHNLSLINLRAFKKKFSMDIQTDMEILNKATTELLSASEAVHKNHPKILPEDVIMAWKIWFKLLDTDITKLGKPLDRSVDRLAVEQLRKEGRKEDAEKVREYMEKVKRETE